ncbi:MAG TPA: hypothetical protein VFX97_02650 [Pyrinomonadaceae bacterium]|nr:hypothetical protein [Pyrinomonadaceae bacterium]
MKKKVMFSAVALALLLVPVGLVTQAQVPNQKPQSSYAGKYEATVKGETGEQKISLEVLEDAGKFSGALTTARGAFKIIKGTVADGVLTVEIEKPGGGGSGPWKLRQNGSNLTATFSEAGKEMTVEFRRIVADEISGEWDAVADASGQPFPFTLTLKLEGEKVTGSSASQLGNSNISEGSWKDGKLALIVEGGSGKIALAATMIDGKLSGDFDFAGQLQGKWVAIRKK